MSIKDDLIGAKGGASSFRTSPDNLRSTDTFEALIGLCSGRIRGLAPGGLQNLMVDNVPIEDGSGNTTLNDFNAVLFDGDPAILRPVTLQLGGSSGAQTVNRAVNNSNQAVGTGSPGEWRFGTVPQSGVDYIDLRFIVNSLYRQDKKGIYNETASLEIELQPSGSSTWINPLTSVAAPKYTPNGIKAAIGFYLYALRDNWATEDTWNAPSGNFLAITGKTSQAYVKELRIAVPNTGSYANKTWQVRVRLRERDNYTKDQDQETRAITWESVAGVSMTPLGNSEEWRGLAYLQVNGKASDQLSGIPTISGIYDLSMVRVPPASVWDAETRVYTGATWDGATEEVKWTQCPAFQMKDLIEDGVSGISALTPGSTLNKWDVLEASKWYAQPVPNGSGGTHPRYSMNYVLDNALSVNDLMQYVAGAVGSYAWDEGDGNWRLVVEKPENATALFTKESIVGEFNYSHTDIDSRINDMIGVFRNADRNFEEDRVRVFDQPHIDNYGRRASSVALVGCTNRQEALRRIKLRQLVSLKETRQVTFVTNRQGSLVQPFSVILVADGDLGSDTSVRTTGRLINRVGKTLTVRDPMRLEVGVDYKIHITVPNPAYNPASTAQPGSADWRKPTITLTRNIVNDAASRGDVTLLMVETGLPANTPTNAQVALEAVGLPTVPKQYRVIEVEPQDNEMIAITAIEIYTNKWNESDNVNESEILAQRPNKIIPTPLTPADGAMFSVKSFQAEFQKKRILTVRWDRPASIWIDGFKVEYSLNNGPWVTVADKTQDSYVELQQPENGVYAFRIATIDRRGGMSAPLIGTYELADTSEDYAPVQTRGLLKDRPTAGGREGDKYTTTDQNPNLTYIWSNGQWYEESNFVNKADQIKFESGVTVESKEPAQKGADVTGLNKAADTNAVSGRPAGTLLNQVDTARDALTVNSRIVPLSEIVVDISNLKTTYGDTANAAASASAAVAARDAAVVAQNNANTARTDSQSARDAAQTAQSLASGYATDAVNARKDATAAKNDAQSARDAAQTAKQAASDSASASAQSATNANGFAQTASGQATIATQKADAAGTSATNAKASEDTARTQAGLAKVSSDSAAVSESNALGSKTAAATSAGVSASARDAAISAANALYPERPNPNAAFFQEMTSGSGKTPYATDPARFSLRNGGVPAYNPPANVFVVAAQRLTLVSGRIYEIEAEWEVVSLGSGSNFFINAAILPVNTDGTSIANTNAAPTVNITGPGTYVAKFRVSDVSDMTSTPVVYSPSSPSPIGLYFVRTRMNQNSTDYETYFKRLTIKDVTGVVQAEKQAFSAATSASSAATSKDAAGVSASAAKTSETNANTSAGTASTKASEASTSATNALGSANSASTSASVSASNVQSAQTAQAFSDPEYITEAKGFGFTQNSSGSPQALASNGLSTPATYLNGVWGTPNPLRTVKVVPATPGRVYEVQCDAICDVNDGSGLVYAGSRIWGMDAAYNGLGEGLGNSTSRTGVGKLSTKSLFSDVANPTLGIAAWPVGSVWLRAFGIVEAYQSYPTALRVTGVTIRDVTSQVLASQAASAAATSAATASTKADAAGVSATSAQTSATNADTARGQAQTFANQASSSKDTAAGSASTATQQAGVAASSADAASASAKATVPNNFADAKNWAAWNGWGGSVAFSGGLANIKLGGSFYSTFVMPLVPGETYRISARHRTINQGGGTTYIGTMDSGGGRYAGGNAWWVTSKGTAPVGVWEVSTFELTAEQIAGQHGWINGFSISFLTGYPGTSDAEVSLFGIENITSEKKAAGSATAAAGSASTASTKATEAGQSASAALASATNASTDAGKASTSASQASTSESNALGSKNAAASSATVAASASNQAAKTVSSTLPSDFSQDSLFWLYGYDGIAANKPITAQGWTFVNVAGEGRVAQMTSAGGGTFDVSSVGSLPIRAGRRYRFTLRARSLNVASSQVILYPLGLAADGITYAGDSGSFTFPLTGAFVTYSGEIDANVLTAQQGGVGPQTNLRILARVSVANGATVQLAMVKLEDITSEAASKASADASATSASNAAASNTAAGQSASAAKTSETNASTSAGNASTSAGQASTSASNALGSSNTASTAATNAANSRDAAGNSASAAAGSASTAGTKADAAGVSASAANTAKLAAEAARDGAAGSASVADSRATSATNSASAALASQTVSARFAQEASGAASTGGRSPGAALSTYTYDWQNFNGEAATETANRVVVNGKLRAFNGAEIHTGIRRAIPVNMTDRYRFRMEAECIVAGNGDTPACVLVYYNSAGAYLTYHYSDMVRLTTVGQKSYADHYVGGGGQAGVTWVFPAGTAYVRPVAIARGNNGATIQINDIGVQNEEATKQAETSAASAAGSAVQASNSAASAQQSSVLSAQAASPAINRNSTFADFPDGTPYPTRWANWGDRAGSRGTGLVSKYSVVLDTTGIGASGYRAGPADDSALDNLTPGSYYVLEAEVTLNSGSFADSGLHAQFYDASNNGTTAHVLGFSSHVDGSGRTIGAGIAGKTYRFTKLIQDTSASTKYVYFYIMGAWSGFGAPRADKNITFHRAALRRASSTDITEALVSQMAGVLATVQGKTSAYWEVTTNAGSGASTFITAQASKEQANTTAPFTWRGITNVRMFARDVISTAPYSGWGVSAAYSTESYSGDCGMFATVPDMRGDWMLGLTRTSKAPSTGYDTIDYAFHGSSNGSCYAYYSYNGNVVGDVLYYPDGSVVTLASVQNKQIGVAREGSEVVYYVGSTPVKRLFAITEPLNLDLAFYAANSRLNAVQFFPGSIVSKVSSTIAMGAAEFHVYNPVGGGWKKALSVVGGNVLLTGGLQAGAYIRLGNGEGWPVALKSVAFPVSDGTQITFGTALGSAPEVDFNTTGLAPLNAGEAYKTYADAVTGSGFIARLKINTPGASSTAYAVEDAASSFGGRQVRKTAADSANGFYTINAGGTVAKSRADERYSDPVEGTYYANLLWSIWVYRSGAWSKVQQVHGNMFRVASTWGALSTPVNLNTSLQTGSAPEYFGVSLEASGDYVTSYSMDSMGASWTVTAASAERSATPNGQTCKAIVRPT